MVTPCDCNCKLELEGLNQWIADLGPVVFTDIDQTQRWGKDDIQQENKRAIQEFQKKGGLLIPITGAPFWHIPSVFQGHLMFGESGGVLLLPDERIVELVPEVGTEAIWQLRSLLGITVSEGLDLIDNTTVLIEGPRYVSLTLVSGHHPHYLGERGDISIERLEEQIGMLIEDHQLPLVTRKVVANTYSWIDVTVLFEKHNTVACFLDVTGLCKVYYLGDEMNDVESMKQPCVVPVGFKNSIPEVQRVIRERGGILIGDKDGPDGGSAEALYTIMGSS